MCIKLRTGQVILLYALHKVRTLPFKHAMSLSMQKAISKLTNARPKVLDRVLWVAVRRVARRLEGGSGHLQDLVDAAADEEAGGLVGEGQRADGARVAVTHRQAGA